jgi:SAM-dependent methyltransferase
VGRRGASVFEPDQWVFNGLAEAYAARPGYPTQLVERLVALAPGRRVCELGAGTGLLASALAERGLEIAAVEPAVQMLAKISDPRVRRVHAAAEDTGLEAAAFELVVLADAAQWVDPELGGAECARLLAPGGVCAVIDPRFSATPFMQELGAMLRAQNPKALAFPATARARQLLALACPGATIESETFHDAAEVDLEKVVRSLSYVSPAMDVRELAARHEDARWTRDFALTWSRTA